MTYNLWPRLGSIGELMWASTTTTNKAELRGLLCMSCVSHEMTCIAECERIIRWLWNSPPRWYTECTLMCALGDNTALSLCVNEYVYAPRSTTIYYEKKETDVRWANHNPILSKRRPPPRFAVTYIIILVSFIIPNILGGILMYTVNGE